MQWEQDRTWEWSSVHAAMSGLVRAEEGYASRVSDGEKWGVRGEEENWRIKMTSGVEKCSAESWEL